MSKFMKMLNNISRSQAIYRHNKISAKDLQAGHYAFVLAICHKPGRSQEELAKELCINKSTVARNLNFLEENGLNTIHLLHNNAVKLENKIVCGTRGWLYDENKYTQQDIKVLNREAERLRASLQSIADDSCEKIVFLHYPPIYGATSCEPILKVLHEFGIKRCFYGHIHGSGAALSVNEERDGIRFRLVSCDFNGFSPILIQ